MIQTTEDFIQLVRSYEAIAFMGNSEGLAVDEIVSAMPEKTLFVFFTGCGKILKGPFPRDALLCHRMIRNGAAFLKTDRRVNEAKGFFANNLKAEIGIIADKGRKDREAPHSVPRQSPFFPVTIDFDVSLGDLYPVEKVPTTGFAIVMWMLANVPDSRLWLCGFTGVSGLQFRLHAGHDWTFEQTALELFVRAGQLSRFEDGPANSSGLDRLARRFPQFDRSEIALVSNTVITKRISGLERQVGHLWSTTKIPRYFSDLYKKLSFRK